MPYDIVNGCKNCNHVNSPTSDFPCSECSHQQAFACPDRWEPIKPMTRSECESAIMEHAKQIRDIYRRYRGDARFLSMSIVNEHISIYNSHWADGGDADRPIDAYLNDDENV